MLRLAFFCSSMNPALAGLPFFLEYLWNYMTTLWHPTSK